MKLSSKNKGYLPAIALIGALIAFVGLFVWQAMVSLSSPCVPDQNYGIPHVVYEATLIGAMLISLLLVGNGLLLRMLWKNQMLPLLAWISTIAINTLITTSIWQFDFGREIEWWLRLFRKQIPSENLIWKFPELLSGFSGFIAMVCSFILLANLAWRIYGQQIKQNENC